MVSARDAPRLARTRRGSPHDDGNSAPGSTGSCPANCIGVTTPPRGMPRAARSRRPIRIRACNDAGCSGYATDLLGWICPPPDADDR